MKSEFSYMDRPWLKFYYSGVPTDVDVPLKSVGEIFEEATEKWKNRTAIIFYGKKIGYREVREKVNRLATALHNLGVKKGQRVAILLLNSPEHIISFYAVVKLGAVVTPISPVYVPREIKHQLEDSGAEHIICQDILFENVEQTEVRFKNVILTNIAESLPLTRRIIGKSILREVYQKMAIPSREILKREGVYGFEDLVKKNPPNPPLIEINPEEDLILLPYTGGTTGQPKGVMLSHKNVIANFLQYKAVQPFLNEGNEVTVGFMPFYHAAGILSTVLFGILSGHVVLIFTTPDLDTILYTISNTRATAFPGSPAMYETLKDYEKTGRVNWKRFKIIWSGGDALHEYTARDWEARTGTKIHEVYGMTELVSLSHCVPYGNIKIGSVGVPFPSTLAAIADPDKDELIQIGELGELVVSGPQVLKGYWRNPEATRESEAIIDGIRWWRTGDLAKMDEDGYFYVYDRKRDLIKYKGLRVYAREVEEVLKNHPKIKQVGVVGVKDIKVGENVKAFVVLESEARGDLSEDDIVQYCKDKLAPYKIPKLIEFVGEIPKTHIGKVSRRELRDLEGT